MLIKIDCREKELLDIMKPTAAPAHPCAEPEPESEPDHYIMDLGDGMTMKVPLPKNKAAAGQKSQRQKPTPKPKSLEHHEIRSERLPLGDVILHDPSQGQQKDIVIFERKTLNDLAASIRDGRYKEQSFRLIETAAATGFHTHNIVYIIEGDLAQYNEKHSQITKTALQSAMVSLMYYKGFSVIRTMNIGETAEFILNFADKVAKEGPLPVAEIPTPTPTPTASYSEVSTKKEKRDFITRDNIGEIMLAQVPGVSAKMAAAILAKYDGSIYEFLGDLHRKISDYEESLSPEMSPLSPTGLVPESIEPMNKNKYKHVSECFKDVTVDGKRGIGKLTVEKVCYFLG